MSEQALVLLQQAYVVATVGSFAFLVALEPRNRDSPRHRWLRLARNLGIMACGIATADIIIRSQGLDIASKLTTEHGLLTPLGLPAIALFAIAFLVIDLFDYLSHRVLHRWRWLWLIHTVHHSDTEIDTSTGVRFHPLETLIRAAPLALLLIALGLPLWVLLARAVLQNPINFYQHAKLQVPDWVDRKLGWVIATPQMHRIHHTQLQEQTDSNYGGVLSIWDRMFGTYVAPERAVAAPFGLGKLDDKSWQTISGMLVTPLRARGLGTL